MQVLLYIIYSKNTKLYTKKISENVNTIKYILTPK